MSGFVLNECEDHAFPCVRVRNPYNIEGYDEWRHLLSSGRLGGVCDSKRKSVYVTTNE